jgi:hypothetical protein
MPVETGIALRGSEPRVRVIAATMIALSLLSGGSSCRRLIFLVSPTGDDLERVIRQRALPRLRLIPWRSHPHVPLFIGRQDHRHGLGMDRLHDGARRCGQEAVESRWRGLRPGCYSNRRAALNGSGAGTIVAVSASSSWVHNRGSNIPTSRTYQEE